MEGKESLRIDGFESFSSPDCRRESGGDARPLRLVIEATLTAG
jgi:hypothetical protein